MSKKENEDENDIKSVYLWWYLLIAALIVVAIAWAWFDKMDFGKSTNTVTPAQTTSSSSSTSQKKQVNTPTEDTKPKEESKPAEENKQKEESESADDDKRVFEPQDVSDQTIESIQTYEVYLKMYYKIIEDYFAQYEDALRDTVLFNEETFQQVKDTQIESYNQQKTQFESIKNKRIIGREDLIKYLKGLRDNLKKYVDDLKASLQ